MIQQPGSTASHGAEAPLVRLNLPGEVYSDTLSQGEVTTLRLALNSDCYKPFVMKLILLDIYGSNTPLKWPGSWHMLFYLHRILYTVGEKRFTESIDKFGHDVKRLINESGVCRKPWISILSLIEAGGWNLRMAVVDERTVVLGLEQAVYIKGFATLMASGNLLMILHPIPSTIERLRQNPPKLHPRVAMLKTKKHKTSLARVKWHGQVIETTDPNSWSEVTALGTAIDPSFRLAQAQRKGANAKEYLILSRKVLGMKVHRMEEYGKLHGLPATVYRCITKYRNSEHLMGCLNAQEGTEMGYRVGSSRAG